MNYGLVSVIDEHVFGDAAILFEIIRCGRRVDTGRKRKKRSRARVGPFENTILHCATLTKASRRVLSVTRTPNSDQRQDFTPSDEEHSPFMKMRVQRSCSVSRFVSLPVNQRHLKSR